MFDRLERQEPAIGTALLEHGSEWAEIVGHVGMDFACADMMVSSIDWDDAAGIVRACSRSDVTPWVRLQAYPWGHGGPDPRLAADVLRALAIGAEGVTASVNTPEQVEAMLAPASDDHRRPYLMPTARSARRAAGARDGREPAPLVFPLLESLEGIDNLEGILQVEGLRAVFLGMSDLCRLVGHPGDDRHRDVRALVGEVVARAASRGVDVFSSTAGLELPEAAEPSYVAEGVTWMWNAGVKVVWVPRPTSVVQRFYARVLTSVDDMLLPG